MAIRTSMQGVVDYLRMWGDAAPDDEFNGVTYWTDEQLQQIADKWSQFRTVDLVPGQTVGTTYYTLNAPNYLILEDDLTVYRTVNDSVEDVVGTYDQSTNSVTFASDLSSNFDYKVEARVIHTYEALADLWSLKANQRANYIDWKAQNNKMNMKQEFDHCVERALYYRSKIMRRFPRSRGRWTVSR